jgi:hypothetical protein
MNGGPCDSRPRHLEIKSIFPDVAIEQLGRTTRGNQLSAEILPGVLDRHDRG